MFTAESTIQCQVFSAITHPLRYDPVYSSNDHTLTNSNMIDDKASNRSRQLVYWHMHTTMIKDYIFLLEMPPPPPKKEKS